MRIAILSDDHLQMNFVREALQVGGHTCNEFHRGHALLYQSNGQDFDLLVVDRVPDFSGPDVIRLLRRNVEASVPVILMTNHLDESDAVSILTAGADNYIVKPVSASVLLARVNALLRRAYRSNGIAEKQVFGKFEFEFSPKQVWMNGTRVPLTQKEFDLALLLFQHLNRPLSRVYIQNLIWRHTDAVSSRTIDTHLSLLRKKLGLRPENGYLLMPIHRYGYRLEVVDIERWQGLGIDRQRMS